MSLMVQQVVVGIIIRHDKVLINKRPPGKDYSDFWEFPGGKIERDEPIVSALKRELAEELGIQVAKAQPWFQFEYNYPEKKVVLNLWQVFLYDGEPHGKEAQEVCWVTYQDLLNYRMLAANRIIVEKLPSLLVSKGNNQ